MRVCTLLLRFAPGTDWPLLVGAVRDEFTDRAWDPPGAHWHNGLVGGIDRIAGGTWLAVDPGRRAMAALLNGARLPVPPDGRRPSRGDLPLAALTGRPLPTGAELARYDGFHLVVGTPTGVVVHTWDGAALTARHLDPGDHVIVNAGVDVDTPLVATLLPVLAGTPTPDPQPGLPTGKAWGGWLDVLGGGGIEPGDPRALIARHTFAGRHYGSTSATLLALSDEALRYDFTAPPGADASWYEVPV